MLANPSHGLLVNLGSSGAVGWQYLYRGRIQQYLSQATCIQAKVKVDHTTIQPYSNTTIQPYNHTSTLSNTTSQYNHEFPGHRRNFLCSAVQHVRSTAPTHWQLTVPTNREHSAFAGQNCKCQADNGQGPQWNEYTNYCCYEGSSTQSCTSAARHYPGPNHQVSPSYDTERFSINADGHSALLAARTASTLEALLTAASALVRLGKSSREKTTFAKSAFTDGSIVPSAGTKLGQGMAGRERSNGRRWWRTWKSHSVQRCMGWRNW
jgi:hypothetical protein